MDHFNTPLTPTNSSSGFKRNREVFELTDATVPIVLTEIYRMLHPNLWNTHCSHKYTELSLK